MRLTTAAIPVFLNAHVLKKSTLAALFLAAEMTGADAQTSGASRERPRASLACQSVTPQTCEIANSLGRGINLGNMLEAPVEGQWGVKLEPAYIDIVAGAFTTVRLPVRWSNNAAPTADATLDEAFAKRVDQVVDALLAKPGTSLHGRRWPWCAPAIPLAPSSSGQANGTTFTSYPSSDCRRIAT